MDFRRLIVAALLLNVALRPCLVHADDGSPEARKGSRVDVAVDEYRKNLGLKLTADGVASVEGVPPSTSSSTGYSKGAPHSIVDRAVDEHRKSLGIGLRGSGELEREPSPAAEGPVPMHCTIAAADGSVSVAFDASRVGSLASDVRISYVSPSANRRRDFVIQRKNVTGYYFVHNRLLIYYSTLVDDREAILDLEYDVAAAKGTISLHLSPVAVSGIPELRDDAGKVSFNSLPTGQLEGH